jgi:hypothetical protein
MEVTYVVSQNFEKKAMLELNIDFGTLLICAEGARLLQEDGTGETPQAL